MKIIHTSDWHIGRTLYGRRRYREFEQLLDWLADEIEEQGVDALFVAGDVFDNSTPSNRALQMYYRFLCRVANSCCRHVVIIAGNHDSPSLLNAPRDVLQFLNVHVVGAMPEHIDDEVLTLKDSVGRPEMLVCAVPYLRDRDVRKAEAGESLEDKGHNLVSGIREHYHAVLLAAEKRCEELAVTIPIVAMGHLFTAGGKTIDGDGVRDLYVGSLAYVDKDAFPASITYLALGHLHMAQLVGGSETRRYSGAPLPMSFSEAKKKKSLCLIEINDEQVRVDELPIPCFQELASVCGNLEMIIARIHELAAARKNIWLEILYDGEFIVGAELQDDLNAALAGSEMEILRIKNKRITEEVLRRGESEETLDDLDVDDVFQRCLGCHTVPAEQRHELMATFKEVVNMIYEDDSLAE